MIKNQLAVIMLSPKDKDVSVPAPPLNVHVKGEVPETNVDVAISVVSKSILNISVATPTVSIPFVPPATSKVLPLVNV